MSKAKTTTGKKKTKASAAAKQGDPDVVPTAAIDVETSAKPKKTKASKPKAPAKDKPLSCLGAAVEVLKASKEPMACKEMIDAMSSKKLWTSDAPTPAATLYSAILREIQKKGKDSRFVKTERGHFTLNA